MRERAKTLVLLGAVLAIMATPAVADIVELKMHNGYGSGPGGEFLVEPISGFTFDPDSLGQDPHGWFETFCVERQEYIHLNTKYYAVINEESVHGGGGPSPDPLDTKTAYLYQTFIDGELNDYDYGIGAARVASADALQDIIWFIEDEVVWNPAWTSGTRQHTFYYDAVANAGPTIGLVRVLNLYKDAGLTQHAQDQLVTVPAPGAALLGMIGLGLVGRAKRRSG